MKISVIGIGNTLRCDDGIGCYAAQILQQNPLPADVTVLAVHQVTPELAENLQDADVAIFIDADCQAPAGSIDFRAVPAYAGACPVTHSFEPAQILAITQFLYGRTPRGVIFSVGADCFDVGERFSPAVEAALPQLIDQVNLFLDVQVCQAGEPTIPNREVFASA